MTVNVIFLFKWWTYMFVLYEYSIRKIVKLHKFYVCYVSQKVIFHVSYFKYILVLKICFQNIELITISQGSF